MSNATTPALVLPDAVIMKAAIRGAEYETVEATNGPIVSIFVHWGSTRPARISYPNNDQALEEFAVLKQWLLSDGGTLTLNGGAA